MLRSASIEQLTQHLAPRFFGPGDELKKLSVFRLLSNPQIAISLHDSIVFPKAFVRIDAHIQGKLFPRIPADTTISSYTLWRHDRSWKLYDIVRTEGELSQFRGSGEYITRNEIDSLYDRTMHPLIVMRSYHIPGKNYVRKHLFDKGGNLIAYTEFDTIGGPIFGTHLNVKYENNREIVTLYNRVGEVSRRRFVTYDGAGRDSLEFNISTNGDTLETIRYAYDTKGRLLRSIETDPGGKSRIESYEYDEFDSVIVERVRINQGDSISGYDWNVTRDDKGRPLRIELINLDGSRDWTKRYSYPSADSILFTWWESGPEPEGIDHIYVLNSQGKKIRDYFVYPNGRDLFSVNSYHKEVYITGAGDDKSIDVSFSYPRGYVLPSQFELGNSLFEYRDEYPDD